MKTLSKIVLSLILTATVSFQAQAQQIITPVGVQAPGSCFNLKSASQNLALWKQNLNQVLATFSSPDLNTQFAINPNRQAAIQLLQNGSQALKNYQRMLGGIDLSAAQRVDQLMMRLQQYNQIRNTNFNNPSVRIAAPFTDLDLVVALHNVSSGISDVMQRPDVAACLQPQLRQCQPVVIRDNNCAQPTINY